MNKIKFNTRHIEAEWEHHPLTWVVKVVLLQAQEKKKRVREESNLSITM